jgi:hypothetical protein
VDVEAEEVDELAGRVDLGLVRGLALAEHGGGVEQRAVARGEQLRGLEEDAGARGPGQARPARAGLGGGVDGRVDVLVAALVRAREEEILAVRGAHVEEAAGLDLAAADEHRDLDRLGGHVRERGLEGGALGRPRGVREDGLVGRSGRRDDGVEHGGGAYTRRARADRSSRGAARGECSGSSGFSNAAGP